MSGGVKADSRSQGLSIETVLIGGMPYGLDEFRSIAADAALQVVKAGAQQSGRFVVECRRTIP